MAQQRKSSKRTTGKKTAQTKKKPTTAATRKATTSARKAAAARTKNVSAAASATAGSRKKVEPVAPEVDAESLELEVASQDVHPTVAMVRGLAAIVEDHGLSELVVEVDDATITLRRGGTLMMPESVAAAPMMSMAPAPAALAGHAAPAAPPSAPAATPTPEPAPADDAHVVTSPFVGTFYRRPNPDASPYVESGARVEKGQVLCIVEAMKLMNEIEADITGTLTEILVDDATPVEYGQSLFKIVPA